MVSRMIPEAVRVFKHLPTWLMGAFVVAAACTMATVRPGPAGVRTDGGYTVSLLLWYLPVVVLASWFLRRGVAYTIQRPAFWTTVPVLTAMGFVLDFFFAHAFFEFPNRDATLFVQAPALVEWVPLEEYLFYVGGFLFILLMYIWCDEAFFSRYNVDYRATWRDERRSSVVDFNAGALVLALVAIAIAWFFKAQFAHGEFAGGFPGYFAYLVVAVLVPAFGWFRATRRFINWRAVALTFVTVLAVSILWEATLAARFEWWVYHEEEMLGVVVVGWHDLPIEAVLVWLVATFTTVVVYETVKLWQINGGWLPARLPATVRRWARAAYYLDPNEP